MSKGAIIIRLGTGELNTGFTHIEMYTAYPSEKLDEVLKTFTSEKFVTAFRDTEQIILTNNHGILIELRLMEYGVKYAPKE